MFDPINSISEKNYGIETEASTIEQKLEHKQIEGLNKLFFSQKCNIESLLRYFSKLKETSQIFIFPYHLKESKQSLHIWDTVNQVENIFIDLMSEADKQNIRLSRNVNTFRKTQCNVWNDRPELISFKRCLESEWQPSVHGLINEELILQISSLDKTNNKIMISLFSYNTHQML